MPVQILIDQAGAPAGIAGQAREDLQTGVPVTLTATGGPFIAYQWSIIDKAVNMLAGVQSAALLTAPLAGVTQIAPIDQVGTYLVQVVVDSGSGLGATANDVARITFYAGAALNFLNSDVAELPRREMAFREETQHNVPDVIFPGGNIRGWAQERQRWQEVLTRMYAGKAWAWGRVTLTGAGAVLTSGFNIAGVARTGVGQVTVTFTRPMPNANYAVIVTGAATGGSAFAFNTLVGSCQIQRADLGGALIDSNFVFEVKALP